MQRRQFLAASLASSAAALTPRAFAAEAGNEPQTAPSSGGEFYQIRRYQLVSGPQSRLTERFISDALIPAVGRMGMGPVGAFRLEYGPQTPQVYVLIPGASGQALAELDLRLAEDAEFMKSASPFWNSPANAPAFERAEVSLLKAFQGWPKLVPPPFSATKQKRIFQLRTYESPSHQDHVRKVEMFNSGEFDIFRKSGCNPVFFGDTLIGTRMPCLTYMLSFEDMAGLEAGWDKFRNDPDWKKLSGSPRYAFEPIVSNISNLVLTPLPASQL
jgi:hypothetical protein